jgi:hypothetical protein
MKSLARSDPVEVVAVLVQINNLRIAKRIIDEELSVINDRYGVFVLPVEAKRFALLGVADFYKNQSGTHDFTLVELIRNKEFSEREIKSMSAECARKLDISPSSIHVSLRE